MREYRDVVLEDTPSLYLRLNEASGTLALDSSGNSRNGTYTGSPTLGSSGALRNDADTAATFSGTGQYVTLGDILDFAATAAFSLECWVKPNNDGAYTYQRLISKETSDGSGRQGWTLWRNKSNNNLGFERYLNDASDAKTVSNVLPAGAWTHIVATYDGTNMRLYINGVVQGSPQASSKSLVNHGDALRVGSDVYSDSDFGGRIDEVAVYDYALSATRALYHYQAGMQTLPYVAAEKQFMWRVHKPVIAPTWGTALAGRDRYDQLTEVKLWTDAPDPSPGWSIDSTGWGEVTVQLPRRLGEVGEGGDFTSDPDISPGNVVECWAYDLEKPNGLLIYRGRLEDYSTQLEPGSESVQVALRPLSTSLGDRMVTETVSFTATDPANMMKWFLDNDYMPGYAWDTDSDTVGTTYDADFGGGQRLMDIFSDILKLCGGTYHYVVQRDQTVRLRATPTSADHTLTLGLNVSQLGFVRSKLRYVTRVLYYYGASHTLIEKRSADYNPADPHDLQIIDDQTTSATLAGQMAQAILDARNVVDFRGTAHVIDSNSPGENGSISGYDIEAIKPLDTVKIVNPEHLERPATWGDAVAGTDYYDGTPAEMSRQVMLITAVNYTPDGCDIEMASRQSSAVLELDDLRSMVMRHMRVTA